MRTDTKLRTRCLRAMAEALGPVEAEWFLTLMLRVPFDYTIWQKSLWIDKSVDEISTAAMEWRRATPEQGCGARRVEREAHGCYDAAAILHGRK